MSVLQIQYVIIAQGNNAIIIQGAICDRRQNASYKVKCGLLVFFSPHFGLVQAFVRCDSQCRAQGLLQVCVQIAETSYDCVIIKLKLIFQQLICKLNTVNIIWAHQCRPGFQTVKIRYDFLIYSCSVPSSSRDRV